MLLRAISNVHAGRRIPTPGLLHHKRVKNDWSGDVILGNRSRCSSVYKLQDRTETDWQKRHWFLVFHISIWGWSFFGRYKLKKVLPVATGLNFGPPVTAWAPQLGVGRVADTALPTCQSSRSLAPHALILVFSSSSQHFLHGPQFPDLLFAASAA